MIAVDHLIVVGPFSCPKQGVGNTFSIGFNPSKQQCLLALSGSVGAGSSGMGAGNARADLRGGARGTPALLGGGPRNERVFLFPWLEAVKKDGADEQVDPADDEVHAKSEAKLHEIKAAEVVEHQ